MKEFPVRVVHEEEETSGQGGGGGGGEGHRKGNEVGICAWISYCGLVNSFDLYAPVHGEGKAMT